MTQLLTGTVTFLFSDIEESTRLLQALGDRWPAALARHHELLRAVFAAEGGEEVGTEGDSFFVAFRTAPAAVAAAAGAQRALAGEPWPPDADVRVRIGLHTGEAELSGESYVGIDVHRASRIAGAGHGGQVLLSDTTRSLVLRGLPDGVELRDLGEHRLKDLEHLEHLWQLVLPGLTNDFAPIVSLDAIPNNLPTRLTTFLGREREIAEVGALLERSRLLTLTGPGGTGKTRLSLEVAARALSAYPAGVFFVELASISDAGLVPPTIGQALGLPDRGGRTPLDRLIDAIGEKRMLLVLDNFEQVVAAGPAIADLLAACRNLTVLASTRTVLHVSGEQEYAVPPLGLPDAANLPPLARLGEYEAVALFVERARSVKSDFELTDQNAAAVAEICVRLDGLPLAIELAAARIRILTPQAMLARLEDRLGLLAGGARDLPERQQTLRGAIAWSHDMLDDGDRSMFALLSVFVGGAGLDAIERVCGSGAGDLLDTLGSLVEKSLMRQVAAIDGQPRFAMLETIREFAIERAVASGRWELLSADHARYFLAFAEESSSHVMGSEKRAWLDRLEEDHDNLRAAIGWSIEMAATDVALRLGATLWRFWQMRGYLAEGMQRLEQVIALPEASEHPTALADALSAAAGLAYWQADGDRSRALYEQEIAARRALGDRRGLAEALYGISFTWSVSGLHEGGNASTAMAHVNEALAIFRELGDVSGVGRCQWALANVAYGMGRTDDARTYSTDALAVFESIDDRFMVGWTTYTMALADLTDFHAGADGGRLVEASRRLRQSLEIFSDAQDVSGYTLVLDALALVAYHRRDLARAARLSGAVARLERTSGTGLNLWNRGLLGFDPEGLRADPAHAREWAAGEELTADQAVAFALEGGQP